MREHVAAEERGDWDGALATFARKWKLRLAEGHKVVPQPIVTLRAKHGMRMVTLAR